MENTNSMTAAEAVQITKAASSADVFQQINNKIKFAASVGSFRTKVEVSKDVDNKRITMYYKNLGYSIGIVDNFKTKDVYIQWKES